MYVVGFLRLNSIARLFVIGRTGPSDDGNWIFCPIRPGVMSDDIFRSQITYDSEMSYITERIFNQLAPEPIKERLGRPEALPIGTGVAQ